jgi:hypothetical protein
MTHIQNHINCIEKNVSTIRNIITRKLWIEVKENHSFNEMMAEELQIEERQLPKVLSALDVIGDTDEAIMHFVSYGLNNSSKDVQIGEKYLKLYGILNALNMHKEAILALASVFGIDNNLRKDDSIDIFNIRSKLAGHSTSHTSAGIIPSQAYAPIRMTIDNKTLSFMNMDPLSQESETIDLSKEIETYMKSAEKIIEATKTKISELGILEQNDEDDETDLEQVRKLEELCKQFGITGN